MRSLRSLRLIAFNLLGALGAMILLLWSCAQRYAPCALPFPRRLGVLT
jgi:hypothetical protein